MRATRQVQRLNRTTLQSLFCFIYIFMYLGGGSSGFDDKMADSCRARVFLFNSELLHSTNLCLIFGCPFNSTRLQQQQKQHRRVLVSPFIVAKTAALLVIVASNLANATCCYFHLLNNNNNNKINRHY